MNSAIPGERSIISPFLIDIPKNIFLLDMNHHLIRQQQIIAETIEKKNLSCQYINSFDFIFSVHLEPMIFQSFSYTSNPFIFFFVRFD